MSAISSSSVTHQSGEDDQHVLKPQQHDLQHHWHSRISVELPLELAHLLVADVNKLVRLEELTELSHIASELHDWGDETNGVRMSEGVWRKRRRERAIVSCGR